MNPSSDPTIRRAVQQLRIPDSFSDAHSVISDGNSATRRDEDWISQSPVVLSNLREYLDTLQDMSVDDVAHIVVACAPFEQDRQWCREPSNVVANDILRCYATSDMSLLKIVLGKHVKPAFQQNPHPSLNIHTGRILPSYMGGTLAQQDYLENQVWKQDPGLIDVVAWCLRHMDIPMYEELWPFVVPPLMILLDDHEVRYKLQGVLLVQVLLQSAPSALLIRTGVNSLIFTSIKKSLSFLHNPMTPPLIRAAVPASVTLVAATTSPGTAERFNQLCEILGDGIIGGVWMYGSSDQEAIEASLEVLPNVFTALGIGTARFLKAIVPQLVHTLTASSEHTPSIRLQLLSARALVALMDQCSERMPEWKGTILSGIAQAWTKLVDLGLTDTEPRELEMALQSATSALARACPSLETDQLGFPCLLQTNEDLFRPLLADIISVSTG